MADDASTRDMIAWYNVIFRPAIFSANVHEHVHMILRHMLTKVLIE
jgi:hypothetical protein